MELGATVPKKHPTGQLSLQQMLHFHVESPCGKTFPEKSKDSSCSQNYAISTKNDAVTTKNDAVSTKNDAISTGMMLFLPRAMLFPLNKDAISLGE